MSEKSGNISSAPYYSQSHSLSETISTLVNEK